MHFSHISPGTEQRSGNPLQKIMRERFMCELFVSDVGFEEGGRKKACAQ